MGFSKNVIIPNSSIYINRCSIGDASEKLSGDWRGWCIATLCRGEQSTADRWHPVCNWNLIQICCPINYSYDFKSRSFPCIDIRNSNRRTAIVIGGGLKIWCYNWGYPSSFIESSFFSLIYDICLGDLEFAFHCDALAIESFPFQIIDPTIISQSNNSQTFNDKERAFYGVLPPFTGCMFFIVGMVGVGIGWWRIRFGEWVNSRQITFSIGVFILGCLALWTGIGSLLVWSLTW